MRYSIPKFCGTFHDGRMEGVCLFVGSNLPLSRKVIHTQIPAASFPPVMLATHIIRLGPTTTISRL